MNGVCYGEGWGCWVDNGFGMAFEFGFGFKIYDSVLTTDKNGYIMLATSLGRTHIFSWEQL